VVAVGISIRATVRDLAKFARRNKIDWFPNATPKRTQLQGLETTKSCGGAVHDWFMSKKVVHISEAEAASDFASLMARVRFGAEVVIESNTRPIAVVSPAEPHVRLLSESLRLAREHGSTATLDGEFANDATAAIS
jgi:antitoxin (DNA-binding transcriptional repressor) of toxin-antitoxin stability system